MFGQPAYYGRMREPFRSRCREIVDETVARLNAGGLTITVDHAEYGWEPGDPFPFDFGALVTDVRQNVIPAGRTGKRARDMDTAIENTLLHLIETGRLVPDGVNLVRQWQSVVVNEHGDDWDEVPADTWADAQKHIGDWMAEQGNDLEEGTRLIVRSRWTTVDSWTEVPAEQ